MQFVFLAPKPLDMGEHSANFYVMYLLTHLSGLTLVGLMISWLVQHMGGFSWSDASKDAFFNYHPLFMTIGMIYFLGTCEYFFYFIFEVKTFYNECYFSDFDLPWC